MTHEEMVNKHAKDVFEFFNQIGILDDADEQSEPESADDESNKIMYADVRWSVVKAISDAITEATKDMWADEDMKEAFNSGANSTDNFGRQYISGDEFLTDYKQSKQAKQ